MILKRTLMATLLVFFHSNSFAQEKKTIKEIESINTEFIAVLKKNTVIVDRKSKQSFVVPENIKVKAKQHKIGGQYSDIYTANGKKKYYTLTENLVSLEEDQKLAPQVDHLSVYDNSGEIIHYNNKFKTLSFINYQLSFISTKYYAEIYRGTSNAAVENQFGMKQYFSHPTIPIDFGIAGSLHRGFWNDEIGTITWNTLFVGPTLHTKLWESQKGALHLHVSALKSIYDEATFDPDKYKFSSNLLRIELSQSFNMKYGSFILGGAFSFMQSSVKETTAYLETNGDRNDIIGVGVTIGFLKPWILNL